jgi:hypothetical protein
MSEEGLCLFWAKVLLAELSHLVNIALGIDPPPPPEMIPVTWYLGLAYQTVQAMQ